MMRTADKHRSRASGFSMVELLIVIVIILVITAIAVPNLTQAIQTFRLRGSVSSLAGLLQEARINAVKQNMITKTEFGAISGATVAFVDLNFDDKPGSYPCFADKTTNCTEPLVPMASGVTNEFGKVPTALDSATYLGYTNTGGDSSPPFLVGFNQRGLPCTPDPTTGRPTLCTLGKLSTSKSSSNGFIYYFTNSTTFGARWAALTITPAGRIRVWTLAGTTWN